MPFSTFRATGRAAGLALVTVVGLAAAPALTFAGGVDDEPPLIVTGSFGTFSKPHDNPTKIGTPPPSVQTPRVPTFRAPVRRPAPRVVRRVPRLSMQRR